MIDVAEAVVQAALERKESRGSHQRIDFPEREPDVVIHTDLGTLSGIAKGTIDTRAAIDDGLLVFEGSREAVRTYRRLFRPVPADAAA